MRTLPNLSETLRRCAAASLEIDGRADLAALVAVPGHISEFTYARGVAYSTKAKQLDAARTELESAIASQGAHAVIADLRVN